MEKNFETLMEDQKFVEKIVQMESKEEVKKAFEAEGVKITDEQLDSLGKMFNEIVGKLSTLNEDELQAIAGGVPECFPNFLKSGTQIASERGKASLVEAFYNAVAALIGLMPKVGNVILNRVDGNRSQPSAQELKQPEQTGRPVVQSTTAGGASTDSNAKYYVAGATALAAAAGVGVYAFRKDIRRWFSK